jgi:protoporphyrinogen oxidase
MKTELFGYVPGGYARILDQLQQRLIRLGVTLRADSPVSQIQRNTGGGFDIQMGGSATQHFDQIIYTIPGQAIADSCGHLLNDDENSRLCGIQYLGVICASLLLRKPISRYYVTNIVDTWVPLTAVIEMSTIVDPESQLGGNHLVYLPKYMPQHHDGLNESDADYQEKCLSTLEKMYPSFSRDDVVAMRVARAKRVAALQTIGYSDRLPPVVTSVPGLYVIHSAQILKGSLNVNETLSLAEEKLHGEVWPVFKSLA